MKTSFPLAIRCVALAFTLAILPLSCAKESERSLSVTGVGTVTFVPDMVVLSIQVRNVNPALNQSLTQTKATVADILSVCEKYGVAKDDIKSSHVGTDKEYKGSDYDNTRRFVGYSATQTTQVTYRNLADFEKFSESLLALRVTSVDVLRFDHSKRASYEADADLLAVDDAKLKALKIAERMGVKISAVLRAGGAGSEDDSAPMFRAEAYSKSLGAGIIASPGILAASRTVTITYRIR